MQIIFNSILYLEFELVVLYIVSNRLAWLVRKVVFV